MRLPSLLLASLSLACAPRGASTEGPAPGPDDTGHGDTGPDDTGAGETGTGDTTTPALLSSIPAHGATGVDADTLVVLTFSEEMDAPSVEAALTTFDPAMGRAWNAERTELTLTPSAPLEYAEGRGDDPSLVDPLVYTLTVGTEARSATGAPLAAPIVVEFSTWRRMYTGYGLEPRLTGHVYGDDFEKSSPYEPIQVGDRSNNAAVRGFVTFDVSGLPATARRVESATWYGALVDTFGNASTIGEYTRAEHVHVGALDQAAFEAAPLSVLGDYSTWSDEALAHDVTAAVQDDLDHREERGDLVQFRIAFASPSNFDDNQDYYAYDGEEGELAVTYLAP